MSASLLLFQEGKPRLRVLGASYSKFVELINVVGSILVPGQGCLLTCRYPLQRSQEPSVKQGALHLSVKPIPGRGKRAVRS